MPHIEPISELRNTNKISKLCYNSHEPVFITKNGRGHLVVMSMDLYEKQFNQAELNEAIEASEAKYAEDGILLDADEVLADLRSKYFG